jgi:hypothetical protein
MKKKWQKWLFPVSILGAAYLVIDYNKRWLSGFLPKQVHFFTHAIPFFYYVNVVAGIVALYFLVRNFLNARHSEEKQMHEFSKRNLIIMGALLLLGSATFGVQKYVEYRAYSEIISLTDSTSRKSGVDSSINNTSEIKLVDKVISSDDPAKYSGEWQGHWIDYEVRTDNSTGATSYVEVESQGVAFEFSISFENSKCKVVLKNIEANKSSTLWGMIKLGKIQIEGNESDFYKYQLPTVSLLPNDELFYQDGGGNIKLKRMRNKNVESAQIVADEKPQESSCIQHANYVSVTGGGGVNIKFTNNLTHTIKLYWIDFNGEHKFYGEIVPNNSILQPTYIGHVWQVTDDQDHCLKILVAGKEDTTVTIEP